MKRIWKKPELMSPAGYWPQLKTAIEAGADAVYFGLKHFTARAKVGFGLAELPEVMQTLHARGVKGFVTFNTLVFDHELLEAEEALAAIAEAGAEAQVGTKHLQLWLDAGIRHFRLEFVHESAQQVRQVVGAFHKAFAGEMPLEHLERALTQLAPQGITEGSLFVPLDYSRVPQLG